MDQKFNQFLSESNTTIPIFDFLINIILCYTFAYFLKILYIKFGSSLSNRNEFSKIFTLLALVTMLIITIVKSSLALSLGLVGALSIVRFRSAIKEPEELTFLFFCIAIGLGFGAGQSVITIVGFLVIVCSIIISYYFENEISSDENLFLTISINDRNNLNIDSITDVLFRYCKYVDLKRYDEDKHYIEINYIIAIKKQRSFSLIRDDLLELNKNIKVTFIEYK
jgi:hypothetical protein